MKYFINSLFTLITLTVISVRCKHDVEFTPEPGRINNEFKSYTVFPKGSYWVYEETDWGGRDSVYLAKSEIAFDKEHNGEKFECLYISSRMNNDTIVGAAFPSEEVGRVYKYEENWIKDYSRRYVQYLDHYPAGYEFQYTDRLKVKYEGFLTNFEVKGVTYKDVKIFGQVITINALQTERIYWAKNVGIIRRETHLGHVWELKRFYINK